MLSFCLAWTWEGLVPVVISIMSSYVLLSCDVLKNKLLLQSFLAFGSYCLSASSSRMIHEPREEKCDVNVTLWDEYSAVSYSLHVDKLWVSVLIAIIY